MALQEAQVLANELERVNPKVPTLFDREATWFSTIEKRPVEKVSARDMRVPLEIRPGGNFGHFDPDGGDLGLGDGPSFDKALVPTVHLRHGVQWTKKAEWATDDARKAVLNTFRHLLAKSMAEFRRHVDSLCMTGGDGVVGTISNVATAAGVDTYTLDSDGFGARLLRYGQTINVYNAALGANRTAGAEKKISFHDLVNKQIKVPAVAGAIATDKIVVSGLSATPPVSLLGIRYHHSDASAGSWLGFDRATTPEIRANRVSASGGLALPFPRLAINKIGDRVGMDYNAKLTAWMHPCQKQAYEELGQLVSVIQKQAKQENLDLYFSDGMQMAGAPVKTSYSWDKTKIDFVNPEVWGRAEMNPAGFYTVDGRKIFEIRGASGGVATSQIFYIVASFNLFVNNPAACSYIDGLTVPTGY
jgi:hypothetical protein